MFLKKPMDQEILERIEGDTIEYLLYFWHYNNKTEEGMVYVNGVKLTKC